MILTYNGGIRLQRVLRSLFFFLSCKFLSAPICHPERFGFCTYVTVREDSHRDVRLHWLHGSFAWGWALGAVPKTEECLWPHDTAQCLRWTDASVPWAPEPRCRPGYLVHRGPWPVGGIDDTPWRGEVGTNPTVTAASLFNFIADAQHWKQASAPKVGKGS